MIANKIQQKSYFLLGHRGARAEFLENSLAGFIHTHQLAQQKSTNHSLDGIEFDIQMTADGEFVIFHDNNLQRLCGLQSHVNDLNKAQFRHIYQSDWQRFYQQQNHHFIQQPIIDLTQILPLLNQYQHIELEIKTHVGTNHQLLAKNLLRLLSNNHWQSLPITLTSFDSDLLFQLHTQKTPFKTGLLLEANKTLAGEITFNPTCDKKGQTLIYQTCNLACELRCQQIGIHFPLMSENLLTIAHNFGLKVTAWTVNDIHIAKQLIAMGVDCVITDYPSQFLQHLSQ